MTVEILEQQRYVRALVNSETHPGAHYVIVLDRGEAVCTCPDNQKRGRDCKHIKEVKAEVAW